MLVKVDSSSDMSLMIKDPFGKMPTFKILVRILFFLVILGSLCLFSSCLKKADAEQEVLSFKSTSKDQSIPVETQVISRGNFATRIKSTGKIFPRDQIPLTFSRNGIVAELTVQNGSSVKTGQLIAELENREYKLQVEQAKLQLAESSIEVDDQLIAQGGKKGDSTSVRKEVYEYIKLKSGFSRALLNLKKAELDLSSTYLYAPIDGIVGNLTLSRFSQVISDKPICVLINRVSLSVQCFILETEIDKIAEGQTAIIYPVNDDRKSFQGTVTGINPLVDENGLITVTIEVKRPSASLTAGLNVNVVLENYISGSLTAPKRAVVDRGGRKVIFSYERGVAKWRYVTIASDNEDEVMIESGIESGMEIITSGNYTLQDNVKVHRVNPSKPLRSRR